MAESAIQSAFNYNLTSCDCACEPECACEPDCGCEPSCGCDNSCCGDSCCGDCCGDSCCGCGGWGLGDCLGDCCLGDPCTLQDYLTPCCSDYNYGGWVSIGYYNHNERLSIAPGDELSFNDFPNHLNLDQAWFYIERVADADCCCADYGYRFDIMYGAQAHAAQSYGNQDNVWDKSLDHGPYGWAMPQLYGEVAYGDWSVKAGHFFTPVGYEVIPAPDNFFYSHTLTHYNSEPFTHTGVLADYTGVDNVTLFGGWTLGWDTGFDQFDGGSNFVGGFTVQVTDDVAFTYGTTAGNLGWYTSGSDGYTQHIVTSITVSECTTWIVQSDYTNTNGSSTDPTFHAETGGISNYLFYELNDCWSVGGRAEWWKSNVYVAGDNISYYDITGGINYRPHANVVIRPEIRYDWTPANTTVSNAIGVDYNQTTFAIDAVFTY